MNAKQSAKVNMYRTVQELCNNSIAIVKTNAAFEQAYTSFSTKVSNILKAAAVESTTITGITIDKGVAKKAMCQNAADIAALVFAYANNTKNNTLKQSVNYSISDLLRMNNNLVLSTCQNMYNIVNANLSNLDKYGVTADMLKSFQTSIDNFTSQSSKPTATRSVKSTYTSNIKELMKEADDVLKNELDKLVVNFKAAHPDFVKTYKNARTIIDPATISTKIQEPKKAVVNDI